MSKIIQRKSLGLSTLSSPLTVPDLTELQRISFARLLEKDLSEVLSETSPITDYTGKNYSLVLSDLVVGKPKFTPEEASSKGASYEAPLLVRANLIDHEVKKEKRQTVYLGEIPLMTERGTFIISGNERVVVSQLARSPGVYFESEMDFPLKRKLYTAEIRPERGVWLGFEAGRDDVLSFRINRTGRKIAATVLLKAFGSRQKEIVKLFQAVDIDPNRPFLMNTLEKDPCLNQEEACLEIYRKMRPGDPSILENAKSYFDSLFNDPRRFSLGAVGRYKMNMRLNLEKSRAVPSTNSPDRPNTLLSEDDLIATLSELIHLSLSQEEADDIDHLANRRLRMVGELIKQSFRLGLLRLERLIKERLSVTSREKKLTPTSLVNARPITAAFNQFLGSSQLSQYMHQVNPLQELEHLRTVTTVGPGGLTRERAGVAVRDVQSSHYGRVDVFKTPEGPNIGLNLVFANYTKIDQYGFLLSPYRKVVHAGGESVVTNEVIFLPADEEERFKIAEATVRTDHKGRILEDRVAVRFRGDFFFVRKEEIGYVDAHSGQMTGVSSGLIPFLSSDVGTRALVGSNMAGQSVPLVRPQAPRVGTGLEKAVVRDAGRTILAKKDGVVEYVDAERIEVSHPGEICEYRLTKFMRTNDDTCYNQTPRVKKGEKVQKGDPLTDGPSSEAGELALGRDLLTAFIPWEGYNYEDSIVISERVVREDLLTSIHIKEYEAQVMDTKLGPEEVTPDIPNVAEETLRNLGEDGIVVLGAEVHPRDILVGKIAPKGETELTAEERLLRAIFGEKAREIRDTSLIVPHGDRGIVVSVKILDKSKGDELSPGVLRSIRVKVAQKRKIQVGDKIAGRHGSKGVVAKIVPEEDMPFMEDGTAVDVILNPISILARMNVGQILETHLGWAAHVLSEYYAIPAFDKLIEGIIAQKLKEANLPETGKVRLLDGRTGEPFKDEVTVGYAHIMKLIHLVEDKVHARSTGPYSLVTQQPLGGKAQMGGQRLGEMEVWALEAYGAAHTLQEMLTIKSDDVVGRAKAFEAIIKGAPIPEARLPEAFKLLVKELNSLCLAVDTVKLEDHKVAEEKSAEELVEEAEKKV